MRLLTAKKALLVAKARRCVAFEKDDLFFEIQHWWGGRITVTAVSPGLWSVLDIMRACRQAHLSPAKKLRDARTTPPAGIDTYSHGLDEYLIAQALAADGMRPYHRQYRTAALQTLLEWKDGERKGYGPSRHNLGAALVAVEGAGLAKVIRESRFSITTAKLIWLDHAKRRAGLTAEDDAALLRV